MDTRLKIGKLLAVAALTATSGCVSEYGFEPDLAQIKDLDQEPKPSPTVSVTPQPSPKPTPTKTPDPEPTPSPTVTVTPSPEPSPTVTVQPSPSPSPTPTKSPDPDPTPTPTKSPDPEPTPSPTVQPSPSPTPIRKAGSNEFRPAAVADVKVDMLFVVDNSGSMQENQNILSASFGQFINEFVKRDVSFHIGIITTDVSNANSSKYWSERLKGYVNPRMGCLLTRYAGERFLTNDSKQLVSKFQQNIKVGTNGSGYEQGLNSLSYALDDSRTKAGGCNDGFLRDDAMLWVGIVSDENEDLRNGETPSQRANRILSVLNAKKGAESRGYRADLVIDLNAKKPSSPITYPLSASINPYPEVYRVAAEALKARMINIANNFSKELVGVGSDIINQAEREFKLSHVPINGTLVVRVNGSVIALNDPNGYVYHADRNTIELRGDALDQSAGGTVLVEYEYLVQ